MSTLLGQKEDSLDYLTRLKDTPAPAAVPLIEKWEALSDSNGDALMTNLPVGAEMYAVNSDKYDTPIFAPTDSNSAYLQEAAVFVHPAQVVMTEIKLEHKGASSLTAVLLARKKRDLRQN